MTGDITRDCGKGADACMACCVGPSIEAPGFEKPMHRPCRHLRTTGGGCSIYRLRPRVCRNFRCGWLNGGDTERPDRFGVLYWTFVSIDVGDQCVMLEIIPGALEGAAALDYRHRKVAEGEPVLSVPLEGIVRLWLPRRFMLLNRLSDPTIGDGREIVLMYS